MLDFINGNKFADVGHFCIDSDHRVFDPKILSKNAIIYCKTDFILELFNFIRFSARKYVLISHMSDYSIDEGLFKLRPPCIVKWFAQNAIYNHPDLIPIPIGIENHEGTCKGSVTDHKWLVENVERLRLNLKDEKTLYCNWYSPNNPRERVGILQKLRNNNIQYKWDRNSSEEDMENLREGEVKGAKLSWYDYCDHISRYKFMICPPGHGVSVHQPFEAMYFGGIPIVIKHNIYKNCEDMPMIQVKSWAEVNYELLELYKNKTFNYDKIYMSYWENLIKDEFNKI